MIVIYVLRVGRATDRADATLVRQHPVEVGLADAMAVRQVILARSAMEPLLRSLPRALWQGLR